MSETPEFPKTSGALFVGAASPLWGYFAGAAAAGVAFWWMTRPLRTENLEALFASGETAALPAPEAPAEAEVPFTRAAEAVASEASGDAADAPGEIERAPG